MSYRPAPPRPAPPHPTSKNAWKTLLPDFNIKDGYFKEPIHEKREGNYDSDSDAMDLDPEAGHEELVTPGRFVYEVPDGKYGKYQIVVNVRDVEAGEDVDVDWAKHAELSTVYDSNGVGLFTGRSSTQYMDVYYDDASTDLKIMARFDDDALFNDDVLCTQAVAYTIGSLLEYMNTSKDYAPTAGVDLWARSGNEAVKVFNWTDRALRMNGYTLQNFDEYETDNAHWNQYEQFDDDLPIDRDKTLFRGFNFIFTEYFSGQQERLRDEQDIALSEQKTAEVYFTPLRF